MLLLTGTAHLIRVITGSATSMEVHASYVDRDASSTTPGSANTPIATAATTTIVGSLPASTVRNVKQIVIRNDDASLSNLITVEHFDGTNAVILFKGTLLAQEWVRMDELGYWNVYGTDGIVKLAGVPQVLMLRAAGAGDVPAADADQLKIFARKRANRMHLKYIGPAGVDQVIQDKISENGVVLYLPNNGSTVGLNLGLGWTTGGTVSHPTPSSTSPAIYNQQKRTRWANVVTTTNQILGLRTAVAEKRFWRGNAAGLGGWNFHARFAIGLWPAATVRLFVGLNDSTAGWVASDTLTGNGCGLWHDTTEAATVLNFVTRDGTTATKAAITLATALAAGQCFDFWMYCPPNGGSIGYALRELNTNTLLVDTTTQTTIPLTTAFMGPELAMSNGTANITVTTTAFELAGFSCQSDN
jgi:hypothetical protein